jgi:hypothetical protein
MKVYVVTRGEYSDYHIVTATTDLAVAEAVAKKFSTEYSRAEIEEYDNAEVMLRPIWFLRFAKNGDVCECRQGSDDYDYEKAGLCGYDVKGQVYVNIIADTAEVAIKAGAERRAKFLAEREGL